LEDKILVVLDQVNDGLEYCVQSVCYYVLSKKTSSCDGNWVAVDHPETFLEDRVLGLSWGDLFLAMVPVQVFLELRINHENWP
jgi:hypothetical protein